MILFTLYDSTVYSVLYDMGYVRQDLFINQSIHQSINRTQSVHITLFLTFFLSFDSLLFDSIRDGECNALKLETPMRNLNHRYNTVRVPYHKMVPVRTFVCPMT